MQVRDKICIQNFNQKSDGELDFRGRKILQRIFKNIRGCDWTDKAKVQNQWRTLDNMARNFLIPKRRKAFFTEIQQRKEISWIAKATAPDGSHFLPIRLLTSSTL